MRVFVFAALLAGAEYAHALHGRFLHLTDMHPDPHYVAGSSVEGACHAGKPAKGARAAGYWGTPASYVFSRRLAVSAVILTAYLKATVTRR